MLVKKYRYILFLLIFSLFPLLALTHPGLPITHDGQDHVARIANFYQNLQEGTFIPRWAGNLNWGYGHPILMFLYPLPSYFASFFHFIGFNFVDSTKLVFAFSYIFSGLTMYCWLQSFLSKKAAFVGSMFYLFAPYRFVDLYVRGAIGEHVAFIFPPLVLYALLKTKEGEFYKGMILGGIALAGLILSHNAVSIMFLPFIILYTIYLFLQAENRIQFSIRSMGIYSMGFFLSIFFWLPATLEGKFTLRSIVLEGQYADRFISLEKFIYSPWSFGITGEFSVQLGIVAWVVVIGSIISLFRKNILKEQKMWIGFLVTILVLSIIFMTPLAKPIWVNIPLIQQFQFPWRFLTISVFLSAVIGAFFIEILPKRWQVGGLILITIGLLLSTRNYWYVKGYSHKPEIFYSGMYKSTTDTGESAPIWSVRFMENEPKAHVDVIGGKASIKEIFRSSTQHIYKVQNNETATLRENTLFFPYWEIFIDGEKNFFEFQDMNNRGVMTFVVPPGEHTILVTFSQTRVRKIADLLTLATIFAVILSVILKKIKLWPSFL